MHQNTHSEERKKCPIGRANDGDNDDASKRELMMMMMLVFDGRRFMSIIHSLNQASTSCKGQDEEEGGTKQ